MTGIEQIVIDKSEANLLAESVAEVARHYNTEIDPKTLAWIGLAGTLGAIYGPRVAAIRLAKKSRDKKGAQVVNFPAPGGEGAPLVNGLPLPGST